MSPPIDPILSAEGEESRRAGTEVMTRVGALLRVGRSYSVQNQLFRQQLEMFAEILTPYLRQRGEMLFVAYGGEIFLDGMRVTTTSHGFRMAKTLITEFEQRGIAGFEVRGEPTVDEWGAFFGLILDNHLPPGAPMIEAARERGLECILPVVRVLGDPSGEGEDDLDPESNAAATAAAAGSPTDPSERPQGRTGALGGKLSPAAAAALGAAPKLYAAALNGLASLLTTTRAHAGLEFRHVRRVVQPIVDTVSSQDPVVLGLAGMIKRDEFTYARNVNACMIATAIGHRLGFARAALADLSVASLLHGIGRSITSEPDRIGPAGAVLLARRATMQATTVKAMRVALEAGAGSATPGRSSVLSQIVGIAATYARMVSARGQVGKSTTPSQALGMIVGPLTGGFDPCLKFELVEVLGLYPPGQFVQLDDGMIAMVIAPNRNDISHPILRPVWGKNRRALEPGIDWDGGVMPPERSIVHDLRSDEMPDELERAA